MNLKNILGLEFKNPRTPKIIFGLAATIAIFFLALKAPSDPDLFWHLKTGELIWQYKIIPHTNWYSYAMPDFSWIDHEWLTEILMFKIKDIFGWAGLSLFFASITAFIFAYLIPQISSRPNEKNPSFFIAMTLSLLGALVSSLVFGIRPQIFTLLGIALVFFVLKKHLLSETAAQQNKIIYALPVLFLFWANMHASFAIGIGLLLIYLVLDKHLCKASARNPKAEWLELYKPFSPELWKKAAIAGALSLAATLINPYGPRIYVEIYRTFSDSYGTNLIQEWLSPNFHSPEGMFFGFFVIFTFIILAVIKKIDVLSFVLIPLFLYLAFQSGRNIPLFVLIALPFLIKSMSEFEKALSEIMQKKVIILGLSAMMIFYPPYLSNTPEIVRSFSSAEKLAQIGSFPEKALEFLKNYPAFYQKNTLNNFAWGGYIIQNLKCKMKNEKLNTNQIQNKNINSENKIEMQCAPKVFIDGRMAHWKTPEQHILKDYAEISLLDDNYQELIEKYQIKIIFIEKNSFLGRALASNDHWKKIYSNDIAVIYELK